MTVWDVDSSPFANYITTNTGPSETELQSINAFLKEPREELRDLRFQIEGIKQTLSTLVEQEIQINRFIDQHLTVVSLVRRVPDEVLSSIFTACLPTNVTFSHTDAPLLLTWVCHRWREVAIATPALWSRVHVAFPYRIQGDLHSAIIVPRINNLRLSAFEEWMRRARDQALALSFAESREFGDITNPIINKLIQPISHRIQSLTIYPSGGNVGSVDIPGSQFPELRRINLRFLNEYMDRADSILCAPKLNDVKLGFMNVLPNQLPLQWKQLTRLSLTFFSDFESRFLQDDLLDLVESSPLLHWLDLNIVADHYGGDESTMSRPPRRIVHSDRMKYFSLTETPDISTDIFDYFSFPSMTNLAIRFDQALHPGEVTILSHASTSLVHLSITANNYSSLDLIKHLSDLKALETLIITGYNQRRLRDPVPEAFGFNEKVLNAMALVDNDTESCSPLCPSLTILEIRDNSTPRFSMECLVSFMKARTGRHATARLSSVARLRRLMLLNPIFLGPDIRLVLQEFVEDGLDLAFLVEDIRRIFPLHDGLSNERTATLIL